MWAQHAVTLINVSQSPSAWIWSYDDGGDATVVTLRMGCMLLFLRPLYLQTICKWIIVTQGLSVIKSWEHESVLWSFGVKEKQDRIILSFFPTPWFFLGKSLCLFNHFYILSSDFSNVMNKNSQMYKLESKEGSLIHGHIPNIWWKMEKARKFQKGIYFCFFFIIQRRVNV